MGMCLETFGKFSIEVRGSHGSFVLHHEDEHGPHPEFDLDDLRDLKSAVESAIRYLGEEDAPPRLYTRAEVLPMLAEAFELGRKHADEPMREDGVAAIIDRATGGDRGE